MFRGVFFYGDQNFFIPAWVFLGGIRNYESYNKKVPKELCTKSSLFDGIRKNLENFTDFPFYSLQIAYIRLCPNRNAIF